MLQHSDSGINGWIVIVTERNVYPPKHGCDARISSVIKGLQGLGFGVHLIGSKNSTASQAAHLVDSYEMVDGPVWRGRSPEEFRTDAYVNGLQGFLAKNKNVVAVMVEYLWMVPILDHVPLGIPRIVDTHDMMHVGKDMYGDMYHWIDISREDEAKILSRADIVVAIQKEEAVEFRDMLPEYVEVVELGHPVTVSNYGCDETADIVIVVGSDNPSNTHGMKKFLKQWSRVVEVIPNAELRIYGSLADSVPNCKGMVRYGFFHDLSRAYSVAKLAINPSELGTGLKIKTVDAMARGKAVVSLENGAAGIDDGLVVCGSHKEMADQVIDLLQDRKRRHVLEKKAVEYTEEKYSWKAVFGDFRRALKRWRQGTHYHCLGDACLKELGEPGRAGRLWEAGAVIGDANCMKNISWAYRNGICGEESEEKAAQWELMAKEKELSYSDPSIRQDLWVTDILKRMKGGFFVEAGASGGINSSNTYLLERVYDWKGICVEPNDRFYQELCENRRCLCLDVCLAAGEGEVEFIEAEYYGGIRENLKEHHRENWRDGKTTKKRAVSLEDLLDANNAPRVIDYLSLDLEGSEYEVLKGFPFDKYKIRCMTIEMGNPKELRALVESKGFSVVGNPYSMPHVDWELHCVHEDSL